MKILDPGRYELSAGNTLQFLQKEDGKVIRDGTTNEELLQVLIHRVTEEYQRLPCKESIRALHDLRHALVTFRMRTARRRAANIEGTHQPHDHVADWATGSRGGSTAGMVERADSLPN